MSKFFFKLDKSSKITEKDIEEEKEEFLRIKSIFYNNLLYYYDDLIETEKADETKMNIYIKDKLKKEEKKDLIYFLANQFLRSFGVSYSLFDKNQKEEFINSDLNFESIKKIANEITKKNIEDCKNDLPKQVHECFDDYYFMLVCQINENPKINKGNFLERIRDYFIRDVYQKSLEGIRNKDLFEKIKKDMVDNYGELKEKYGMNRYLEKYFISFIFDKTDYNYKETATILNNYYKNKSQKNKDYKPLKQKED